MSRLVRKVQCPKCLDRGGDNLSIFDDGHGFCFAEHGYFHKNTLTKHLSQDISVEAGGNNYKNTKEYSLSSTIDNNIYTYNYKSYRGITEDTYRFYDVSTKMQGD